MIHLVVVLSAAVFAPSDATHAVHFTTHSSPILSAIALPFTQSSMPSVKPTAASATQTTTAFTPTTFLIAIIRSPDITCLRSKDLISLLWSLQQTNKNNITLPYTNLLEQVWSAHLWKCIHLNLMKQSLSKQTKYNKELMQVHLKQIKHLSWLQRISEQNEAQMSEETKWQMSLTKTPKYNSKLIQWIRMSTEYTHTPQGLKVNGKNDEKIKYLANYHRMSQIQEPSVNNSFVPQTQRNENQSLTLIQRQGKQSSIKFNQQISQAQTPIKNKHGVQKYMYSQKNKQKSQRPLDKDKNMPQTSTYMTKQLPKTKIHIGFSAYMNRLRSPVDKRTPVLQMPVQKNKRQQVLKRDSSQLLYDDSQQMKTQYSPPSHSSMGQEASSLFSKTLIKTQPQVSGLKDSLQLPLFHMALVENVNFTWRAGSKRYYYTFDRLYSQDEEVLEVPVLSLPTHGTVPRKSKVFSVKIKCTGNASGIATFGIGLLIQTRLGKPLPGTPLRLKLRKDCTQLGPDPECDQKCENGGVCDEGQRCLCREGYMGQYCNTALCYPQCMNGGTCTMPGRCSCPPGFQGRHCEGGICQNKCQNGGKCVQKDTCDCRRGYYGNRCEFSKCVIPCVNGGRCRDVNKCRCPLGFTGDHCEVVLSQDVKATSISRCSRRCRHGTCKKSTCYCHEGYTGRWCRRRGGRIRGRQGKKVWV
nr:uncharacterized protein LOC123758250 isoform X2 [Procambarus clarkii]